MSEDLEAAMRKGLTKKACEALETMVTDTLNAIAGEPEWDEALQTKTWVISHANDCKVRLTLICDSFEVGNTYRESFLAGKLLHPDSWRDKDGHLLHKQDIPWPRWFSYPSGKQNWHPHPIPDMDKWKEELSVMLITLTAEGTPERAKVAELDTLDAISLLEG